MSSDRSYKLCGDDGDNDDVTSYSKRNRLLQMTSQQNRNTCSGSSANPPETDNLILGDSTKDVTIEDGSLKTPQVQASSKLSLNLNQPIAHTDSSNQASTSDSSNTQLKNMSKAAVLRHLFFSEINSSVTEPTSNLASSKETN